MPTTITRTTQRNPDFLQLVAKLDAELDEMYGDEMQFYSPHNKVDHLNNCVVVYNAHNIPVACGAIKEYQPGVAEVKRMFVEPAHRGTGLSIAVMDELEKWAAELKYRQLILETGNLQDAAIALYKRKGYTVTENYGQYVGAPSSVCFAKELT